MTLGFILMNTAPNWEYQVYAKLKKLPEVIEIFPLFGEYDFIAKVEGNDLDHLSNIVLDKIRTIEGIIGTCTLNVAKGQGFPKKRKRWMKPRKKS